MLVAKRGLELRHRRPRGCRMAVMHVDIEYVPVLIDMHPRELRNLHCNSSEYVVNRSRSTRTESKRNATDEKEDSDAHHPLGRECHTRRLISYPISGCRADPPDHGGNCSFLSDAVTSNCVVCLARTSLIDIVIGIHSN